MKKSILLITALLMVLGATLGCKPAAQNTPTPAPTEVVPEPTFAVDTLMMSVKPKTVTLDMTEVTVALVNDSDVTYSTDYVQRLEQLVDGAWQAVPLTNEAVIMALLIVPAHETTTFTFDFANHYEALEHGTYRILKTLVDPDGNQVEVTTEFDLF